MKSNQITAKYYWDRLWTNRDEEHFWQSQWRTWERVKQVRTYARTWETLWKLDQYALIEICWNVHFYQLELLIESAEKETSEMEELNNEEEHILRKDKGREIEDRYVTWYQFVSYGLFSVVLTMTRLYWILPSPVLTEWVSQSVGQSSFLWIF